MAKQLISHGTMHRIVNAIQHLFKVFYDIEPRSNCQLSKIGNRLFELNLDGTGNATELNKYVRYYHYSKPQLPRDPVARHAHYSRAVKLLLEQIDSYLVQESPMFDALLLLDSRLAHYIADRHDAVISAPADWPDEDNLKPEEPAMTLTRGRARKSK